MPRFKLKRKTSAKTRRKTVGETSLPPPATVAGMGADAWDELFDRLSGGETVKEICASKEGWPEPHKLHQAISADPALIERYRHARRAAVMAVSEELLPIADDGRNDWIEREGRGGREFKSLDTEAVQRSRLRIDTRLRLLEALDPTTFGKKLDLSNKDGSLAGAWATALGVVNAEKQHATKH